MIEGQTSLHQVNQKVEAKVDGVFTATSTIEERIPSYVGVSCAVSGYRSLNKYDAVIREGFCGHGSPTRIALSGGHDSKGPLTSPDNAKKCNLNSFSNSVAASVSGEQQSGFTTLSEKIMDSPQSSINGHPSAHFSRVIKVEHITSVDGTSSTHFAEKSRAHCGSDAILESDGKSFVQQRIERLYGPAALGMAFQAKRAMLERYKEREKERREEETSPQVFRESPQGFPSVFRHLRPEFRHQLPVKPKDNFSWRSKSNSFEKQEQPEEISSNTLTNGHRVRHIPIELEKDDMESSPNGTSPTEKSWKTLSRDLQTFNECNSKTTTKTPENISSSLKTLDLNKNINSNSESGNKSICQKVPKDGHYFLQVVASKVSLLEPQIEKIEEDLKTSGDEMTEEVKGKLLAASGKAKLLVRQKVEQFKGLCQKNIRKSTTEEFPTTDDDLAGFWDMVSIQVEAVKNLLNEIEDLRKNNWKEQTKTVSVDPVKKPAIRKLKSGSNNAASGQKNSSVKDLAKQKADEERRRQMREALNVKRRQAAKLKKANKGAEVEIFIPEK